MTASMRPAHMDVTNRVDVTDHRAVANAVRGILRERFPAAHGFPLVDTLFADFNRLYTGQYPGFHGCEISYHDSQHVLDVTLAMARLVDGYERQQSEGEGLGECLAIAGIACALFHDAGYIRRKRDTRHKNGAAYTRVHVGRSARFLAEYLPTVGLADIAPLCARVVLFTGYEMNPADIAVESEGERILGHLLGTADLIAQLADSDYPRKCQYNLYEEFEIGGLAGEGAVGTTTDVPFRSPEQLLAATPEFIRTTLEVRLKEQFGAVYRHMEAHFGGPNLYMEAIEENCRSLQALLAAQGPLDDGAPG